jgi:hypothetical protein
MKRLILLIVLIIGYYLSAFAQTGHQFKIDTTFKKFSFRYDKRAPFLRDSIELNRQLYDLKKYKNQGLKPNSSQANIKQQNKADRFCVKPKGNFPMPIYKPDSTVKYHLLIKKE